MIHFRVLNIPVSATLEDADKAYKELAKLYHPDKGGDCKQFQELSSSFFEVKKIISALSTKYYIKNLKDTKRVGGDILVNAYLSIEEYFQGTSLKLIFNRKKLNTYGSLICDDCIGGGLIYNDENKFDICSMCEGGGWTDCLSPITSCICVDIPPFFNSTKMIFEGDGHQCLNGTAGNLHVNINIKHDPLFTINNYDLHTTLFVKLSKALTNYETLIYHPNGTAIRFVSSNILKPGDKVVFKDKGVKKLDGTYGDFIININIIFPDNISATSSELIKLAL